jgi:hypothetical protein
MLTPEDELDVLHEEIGKARRRLWSLENAPYEGRVADSEVHARSVHFARQRLRDLERELVLAQADYMEVYGA